MYLAGLLPLPAFATPGGVWAPPQRISITHAMLGVWRPCGCRCAQTHGSYARERTGAIWCKLAGHLIPVLSCPSPCRATRYDAGGRSHGDAHMGSSGQCLAHEALFTPVYTQLRFSFFIQLNFLSQVCGRFHNCFLSHLSPFLFIGGILFISFFHPTTFSSVSLHHHFPSFTTLPFLHSLTPSLSSCEYPIFHFQPGCLSFVPTLVGACGAPPLDCLPRLPVGITVGRLALSGTTPPSDELE